METLGENDVHRMAESGRLMKTDLLEVTQLALTLT